MGRLETREQLFKLVFEYVLIKEKDNDYIEELKEENPKIDISYLENSYNGIIEKYDSLVDEISALSKGYNKDRIYKVDLALLLVALYEIKYIESIPVAVSINEALNLAKKYSTEKSSGFINGILATIVNKKD